MCVSELLIYRKEDADDGDVTKRIMGTSKKRFVNTVRVIDVKEEDAEDRRDEHRKIRKQKHKSMW